MDTRDNTARQGFCHTTVDRAWVIPAMVFGYIFWWPLGLALTFYMVFGDRMIEEPLARFRDWEHGHTAGRGFRWSAGLKSEATGNTAFDAYKADMLRRLEEEQAGFAAFLARLRQAKDKSEFDTFMDEQTRRRTEERDGDRDGDKGSLDDAGPVVARKK